MNWSEAFEVVGLMIGIIFLIGVLILQMVMIAIGWPEIKHYKNYKNGEKEKSN